jgi:hypothetical protein
LLVFEQISWKLNLRYYFPPTLDVAAFNVQALGQSKSSDAKILEILGDIICRYDLIAIQEVRDAEHKVLSKLMDAVHNRCPKCTHFHIISVKTAVYVISNR